MIDASGRLIDLSFFHYRLFTKISLQEISGIPPPKYQSVVINFIFGDSNKATFS